jgi:hypothetical protein
VKLQNEFFSIYSLENKFNKIIIELNEDNFIEDKNYLHLQNLEDENNYISYLINITNQRLLEYENFNKNINNNLKKLSLTIEDLYELINKTNNKEKVGLICVKSDDNLNLDFVHNNDPKQNSNKIKSEVNEIKTAFGDIPHVYDFSNKLYISSKNNKPINIQKLDTKNIQLKEKEELNKPKINNEKDVISIINIKDLINNENNEYKNDVININQNKNLHIDNKVRKDSLVSDYSYYGNSNNDVFIDQNLFTNINNFNLITLNKLDNEVL